MELHPWGWFLGSSSVGKEPTCQCRRGRFDPWVGKIPWRGKWQPTPVFLPGKIPWVEVPGGLQVDGVAKSRIWLTTNRLSHSLSLLSSGEDSREVNTVVSFTIERKQSCMEKDGKGWNLVLVSLESPFRGRMRRSLQNRVEGGRQEEKGNQSSRQSEEQVRKPWCQRTWVTKMLEEDQSDWNLEWEEERSRRSQMRLWGKQVI